MQIVSKSAVEVAEKARGPRVDVATGKFQLSLNVLQAGVGKEQHSFAEGLVHLRLSIQEAGNVLLLDLSRRLERKDSLTDEDGAGGAVQHRLEEVQGAGLESES